MLEKQRPRRVVPRWRSSLITSSTVEARVRPPRKKPNVADEVARKGRELDVSGSVPVAAELMFLANESGDIVSARRAASIIIENSEKIGARQLVLSAKRVLDIDDNDRNAVTASSEDFIRQARKLLSIDFRNPVLLMDIARALTVRRHESSARRYVRAAVALAPTSRFVVRAAARYYLHIGEYEVAHDLLCRTPLLKSDPWIQASEIAVATVRGRASSLTRQMLRMLSQEKGIAPDASELASAVATVEFLSGSQKKAKQLFQKALQHPNDNSLAQVEWAATDLKLFIDDTALQTPFSFEANSNNAYRRLELGDAIQNAKYWIDDEPFSARPYDALVYLYCLDGQFREARTVAGEAVLVDGGQSYASHLNLLFTKIQNDELDEAFADLVKLGHHPDAKLHSTHLLANAGALAYATGDIERGKEFYERAIRAARAKNEPRVEALARAFFARAASVAGDPSAEKIVAEMATGVERLPSPGAIYVMRSLVGAGRRRQLDARASARVAKGRWEWDAASNTLRILD